MKIKYWFNEFQTLKPFDVLNLEEITNLFKTVNNKIKKDASHSVGWNDNYLNPKTDKIEKDKFWNGFEPQMHFLESFGKSGFQVKSDISSMIMDNYKIDWSHFIYLYIPNELMKTYFISTFNNKNVLTIKKFVEEVDKTITWDGDFYNLMNKYDELYPNKKSYKTFFRNVEEYEWRSDFLIEQFLSIQQKGLIFPIVYNNSKSILSRGTHRAFACELSGYDVPFFIQINLNEIKKDEIYTIETEDVFSFGKMYIDINYNLKKLIYRTQKGEVLYEICN